jgi:hypothetical protein
MQAATRSMPYKSAETATSHALSAGILTPPFPRNNNPEMRSPKRLSQLGSRKLTGPTARLGFANLSSRQKLKNAIPARRNRYPVLFLKARRRKKGKSTRINGPLRQSTSTIVASRTAPRAVFGSAEIKTNTRAKDRTQCTLVRFRKTSPS